MPTMERSSPEIPGSSLDDHKMTRGTKENPSQTQHGSKQSINHQSRSSQASQLFDRSKEMSNAQDISQTSGKYDGGDFPNLNPPVNRTSCQQPREGDKGSEVGRTVQHDPEMDRIQDHEPASAHASNAIGSDNSGRGDDSDSDFDDLPLAENRDVDSTSEWCSICRDAEKWMMQAEGDEYFYVGTQEDLQARAGCPSCDDMQSIPSGRKPINPHKNLYFSRQRSLEYASYSYAFRAGDDSLIFLNPSNRVSKQGFKGRVVDPDWFDITRLKNWLALCDANHGERCHGPPIRHEAVLTRPRYLIDVEQGCLIEPLGDERYFALSYVWGTQGNSGMATRDNIRLLEQKGAITVGNPTFRLPKTIENAIQLTELLGERFLWIDRLCIIQDNLHHWHSQIKKMGSIYANAYCTFVASGGSDADHGIYGLNQHSGPRQLIQSSIRFPSLQMLEVQFDSLAWTSVWDTRGWTFQEFKLSRRVILFNNDVRWICHQYMFQEDTEVAPERLCSTILSSRASPINLLDIEPWPDFVQWTKLVSFYCRRELSYEKDVGPAFAGIEEILSYTFPGGFCFGMPEFYFDIALLWWPLTPQQRRISKPGTCYLPSWSFLGWKGGHPDSYGPAFAYEWLTILPPGNGRLCTTSSISPKVDWVQKGPSGQERRIGNDYHIWKRDQDKQSPEVHAKLGWKRDSNDNEWTHASIPYVRFRYPVPLGFQPVSDEYRTWPGSLRLRSQSAILTISNIIDRGFFLKFCCSTELVTHTGEWAGMLHMNKREAEDVPIGAKCELVALSRGSISNDDECGGRMEEWRVEGRPKATETYEFYNVMWIRREEGYVVRENVGRVEKSVWDRQELQEIDVELR